MASPHDTARADQRADPLPRALTLRDAFRLPALEASVAKARKRVLDRLFEWRVDDQSRQNARLLVSELVTNAIRHTDSDRVRCALWLTGLRLRLEVTDEGNEVTAPRPALGHAMERDTESESGRGLLLVSLLAEEWGVRTDRDHPESRGGEGSAGHAVWAELRCASAP